MFIAYVNVSLLSKSFFAWLLTQDLLCPCEDEFEEGPQLKCKNNRFLEEIVPFLIIKSDCNYCHFFNRTEPMHWFWSFLICIFTVLNNQKLKYGKKMKNKQTDT